MSVCIVHATRVAVAPIEAAFARHWPEAETIQILDESLVRELESAGSLTPAIRARVARLAAFAQAGGAEGVLFSCSAFGAAIEEARARLPLPVLKPNEAMLEEALTLGKRLHLLATFRPSLPSVRAELEGLAARRGVDVKVETSFVEGALDALLEGQADTHDALIARAAAHCDTDAVLLAQFSMARAREQAASRTACEVLTSPDSAVRALRQTLRGARPGASSPLGAVSGESQRTKNGAAQTSAIPG